MSTVIRRNTQYTRLFLFAVYNPVHIYLAGSTRFQP